MTAAETLPELLRGVGAYLEAFAPPTEPFDPVGEWTHTYSIRPIHELPGVQHCDAVWVLRLTHRRLGTGVIPITGAYAPRQGEPGLDRVDTTLTRADDGLSSLRVWDSKTRLVRYDGVTIKETEFRARGVVERVQRPVREPIPGESKVVDHAIGVQRGRRRGLARHGSLGLHPDQGLQLGAQLRHIHHAARREQGRATRP